MPPAIRPAAVVEATGALLVTAAAGVTAAEVVTPVVARTPVLRGTAVVVLTVGTPEAQAAVAVRLEQRVHVHDISMRKTVRTPETQAHRGSRSRLAGWPGRGIPECREHPPPLPAPPTTTANRSPKGHTKALAREHIEALTIGQTKTTTGHAPQIPPMPFC